MAVKHGRLYPSLPSPSSVVLSSDEEEERESVEDLLEREEENEPTFSRGDHVGKVTAPRQSSFCHITQSLSDFEESCLRQNHSVKSKLQSPTAAAGKHRKNPHSTTTSLVVPISSRELWEWVWSFVYKWRIVVMGLLLGLIAVLIIGDEPRQDNLLSCPSEDTSTPCLTESDLDISLPLAKELRSLLHDMAGQFDCGAVVNRNQTVKQSRTLLSSRHHHTKITLEDMKKISYLFIYNPHWNIHISKEDGTLITDHRLGLTDSDIMGSTSPKKSLACQVRELAEVVWRRLKLLALVSVAVLCLVAVISWYYKKRNAELKAVYLLVENIIDVLKAHYQKSLRNKNVLPFLAIIHVRDMLIPPSERQKKSKLWDKAVEWLATQESRVRVETQIIAGQEFVVWKWIQAEPPPTEESDSQSPAVVNSSAWPGRAFEDYPPDLESKVAPPLGTPSPCVRLKNMFQHIKHMSEDQLLDIKDAIVERCSQNGSVVHVYVDKRSIYGCAYFKMSSLESAKAAYKVLHGSWFKGRLITAKYIPESKYYKWFPHAHKAMTPLMISSTQQ